MTLDIHPRGYWLGPGHGHCFDDQLANKLEGLFAGCSVVDLGCGDGSYVRQWRRAGIDADGYDGNPEAAKAGFGIVDLSTPVTLPRVYDWVLSLEVGEHIPRAFEEIYLHNLHRHNQSGIVLSWAIPGQGGHGHVNERDNEWVRSRLEALGYEVDWPLEEDLRRVASVGWFRHSLMIFRR